MNFDFRIPNRFLWLEWIHCVTRITSFRISIRMWSEHKSDLDIMFFTLFLHVAVPVSQSLSQFSSFFAFFHPILCWSNGIIMLCIVNAIFSLALGRINYIRIQRTRTLTRTTGVRNYGAWSTKTRNRCIFAPLFPDCESIEVKKDFRLFYRILCIETAINSRSFCKTD